MSRNCMFAWLALAAAALSLCANVSAVTWYTVGFETNYITTLSGVMTIPRTPSFSGTYYVWPGLQPASGVLQEVCDGRSGTWWIGSGWCCSNPSLPWGSGFNVSPGDQVTFSNVLGSNGQWTCSLSKPGTTAAVSTFALGITTMYYALFAVELYSVDWDFGPVSYSNIQIQTTATSTSVCSSTWYIGGNVGYVINGKSSSLNSQGALCSIGSIYMWNKAAHTLDFLNQLPSGAYSTRLLTQSYHGSCIRARRSNDSATLDVGFASTGVLDTASLLAFIGTNDGYVSTWYDQSGHGNNAVQSTAAQQPQIVSKGALITLSSQPTIQFNSASQTYFSLGSYPFQAASTAAAYVVNSVRTVQGWQRYFDFGSGTTVNLFATPTSTNSFRLTTGGNAAEQGVVGQLLTTTNQVNMAQFHHYGTSAGTMSAQDSIGSKNLASTSTITLAPSALNGVTLNYLGKSQYSADPYFDGWMSEVIFFNADPYYTNQAAQESAFFSSIQTVYGF